MAVRCPRCGSDNPQYARFCSVCAQPIGMGYDASPPVTFTAEKPKKNDTMLIVAIIIVVVVVICGGIAWVFLSAVDTFADMKSGYLEVTIENQRFASVSYSLYVDGDKWDSGTVPILTRLTLSGEIYWWEGGEATHLQLTYGGLSQEKDVILREGGVVQTTFYIS